MVADERRLAGLKDAQPSRGIETKLPKRLMARLASLKDAQPSRGIETWHGAPTDPKWLGLKDAQPSRGIETIMLHLAGHYSAKV